MEEHLPVQSKMRDAKHPLISSVPQPMFVCAAFALGLFVSSISINLALYFTIKGRFSEYVNPGTPSTPPNFSVVGTPGYVRDTSTVVDAYDNIVLIRVEFVTFNRFQPWQTISATFQPGLEQASAAMASGLILEKGLILTSAYVATDTRMLTIQRQGESELYEAKVALVAQDLDIALLTVEDSKFWHSTDMNISFHTEREIIGRGNQVIAAGFPSKGDFSISKLTSRVSRVEAAASGLAGRYGIFPQVVLALYPPIGKDLTVGPVFREVDNALVGFIGRSDKVVPIQTIARLVNAYKKDHTWAGVGTLGLMYRTMSAKAMRMYWDLPAEDVGVQVRSVAPHSKLYGQVKKGDVLVAVDGHPILANGAFIHRNTIDNLGRINEVALPFPVLFAEKSVGDAVNLSFRRSSEKKNNERGQKGYSHFQAFDVEVQMSRLNALSPRTVDDQVLEQPTYFIIGGLVWTVFTESLVLQAMIMKNAVIPSATLAAALHRWRQHEDEEVIVLLTALEHPCNKRYDLSAVQVLKFINGKSALNMKEFVREVGNVLHRGDSLEFTFAAADHEDAAGSENDPDIVLDTILCKGADKELMIMHQIPMPASMNLKREYSSLPGDFTQFTMPAKAPTGHQPQKAHKTAVQQTALQASNVHEKSLETATEKQANWHQVPWGNVVQISFVAADQDFLSPWKTFSPGRSRCSGIIVDKTRGLILTNSHCVAGAKSIDVLREDSPVPAPAQVIEIARDVDLAMITTEDKKFWASDNIKDHVSLQEGLPYISHPVRVVGYPTGGTTITITQGIISRIDGQLYPNGLIPAARNTPDSLLIVQVDAAINPGNSGGPVFNAQGSLIGLAFAGLDGAQSVGYVIPNVHLRNFIAAVSSESTGHRWVAQPELGAAFHRVENPGIRKFLSMGDGETGIQVRSVSPLSALKRHGVAKQDVLLRVDGQRVNGDGKIMRNINGNRVSLPFNTLITEKGLGEKTQLDFIHFDEISGNRSEKSVVDTFGPIPPLVPRFYDAPLTATGRKHFSAEPTYYIKWGLVWGVFSNPVIHQATERKINIPWSVSRDALGRFRQNADEEIVVLLQGLGHPCTMYYDTTAMRIIDSFNGQKVNNMRDLVTFALEAELMKEEYMRITFKPLADEDLAGSISDPDIVLHRQLCQYADKQIMQQYNIESQGSANVAEYFDEAKRAIMEKVKQAGAKTAPASSLLQSSEAIGNTQNVFFPVPTLASDPFGLSTMDPELVGGTDKFQQAAAHVSEVGQIDTQTNKEDAFAEAMRPSSAIDDVDGGFQADPSPVSLVEQRKFLHGLEFEAMHPTLAVDNVDGGFQADPSFLPEVSQNVHARRLRHLRE